MKYAFDLLEDPEVFLKHLSTKRASRLPMVNEQTMVRIACLQHKVALLEYQKTGFLGKLKNWFSNTIQSGLAFVKGLKDKFMDTFTRLTQAFVGSGNLIDLMTEGLQISVIGEVSKVVYSNWWKGFIDRKWAFDTNSDRDYRSGELIEGWFQTEYDRGTKEITSVESGENIAFDYDAYLEGWMYYDELIKSPDSRVQQKVKELRGKRVNFNKMPRKAMKVLQSHVKEIIETQLGKKVVGKILKEVNALLNPLSLWPAMKDTYKTIMSGQEGLMKALTAGVGALLMGGMYLVFKIILAKFIGILGTAGILGGGIIYTMLTKGSLIGVIKSVFAKKIAKKFGKLWKGWFGSSKANKAVIDHVEKQTDQRDMFVKDMQGKMHSMNEVKRHPEMIDQLQRVASRVATRYMAQAY